MKQIAVVADDRVGLLADISYILGKAKINIESIVVQVHGGKAVIDLTVKDDEKATRMLSSNGYNVLSSEVLLVKLQDEPGELSELSTKLREAGINIESLYMIARGSGFCVNALKVDKPKKAKKLLASFLMQ